MADTLKIGPDVGRNDYRTMLAQSLMNSDGFDNRHWTGPVASMASKIGGAMLQKSAVDDQTKQRGDMMATLLAQKNAKPWTNPDTGEVAPGTSGGLEGMMSGLAGMKDNPYAQALLPGLLSMDIAQQEDRRKAEVARRREFEIYRRTRGDSLEDWQRTRGATVEDAETAHERAVRLKGAPGFVPQTPGVHFPYSPEVAAQRVEEAGAKASAGQVTWQADPKDPTKQRSSTGEVKLVPQTDAEKDIAKKSAAAKTIIGVLDGIDPQGNDPKTGKPMESMIDKATGSGAGALIDWAAGLLGYVPEGANEAHILKMAEGQLILSMPRMEGPQSENDRKLYQEMAGMIGDPTVPNERKRQAARALRGIYNRYLDGAPAADPARADLGWSIEPVQ